MVRRNSINGSVILPILKFAVWNRLLICCAMLYIWAVGKAQAPPWQWVESTAVPFFDEVNDIDCDTINYNIFVGGSIADPTPSGLPFSGNPPRPQGIVSALDSMGGTLWNFPLFSSDTSVVRGVTTSAFGNVFVTGEFSDSLVIPSDISLSAFDTIVSEGGTDIFNILILSSGTVFWSNHFGGPGDEHVSSISRENTELFVSGCFESTVDFGIDSLTSAGGHDGFLISMFNVTGFPFWVKQASSTEDVFGGPVSSDTSGVYWSGIFGDADMSLDSFSLATVSNLGGDDIFLAHYDLFGAGIWHTRMGAPSVANPDLPTGLSVDASGVFLAGGYASSLSFYQPFNGAWVGSVNSPASGAQFLSSCNPQTGQIQWSTSVTDGNGTISGKVDANGMGEVYVTGSFQGNRNINGNNLSAQGIDSYLIQYNNNGTFNWVSQAGGTGDQISNGVTANRLVTAVAGTLNANSDFAGIQVPYGGGGADGFIARTGCPAGPFANFFQNLAGPDSTLCADSIALYATLPMLPWQGEWNVISGNAVLADSSQSNTLVDLNNASGINQLSWEIQAEGCSFIDNIDLIVVPAAIANGGPDTSICGDNYALAALPISMGSTGNWSLIAGSGNITDPTNDSTSVGNLGAGNNVFQWAVNNGVCQDTDTVAINSSIFVPALAGPDSNICLLNSSNINLYANPPGPGTGEWRILSGNGTLVDSSQATSLFTPIGTGNTTLIWNTVNGVCSDSDTVIISTLSPVPANAGIDTSICGDTLILYGSDPGTGATGTWSVLNGTGTFSSVNDSNATVSGLTYNVTTSLIWTVGDTACSSSDTINIIAKEIPVAEAGTDTTICDSVIPLIGNLPVSGPGTSGSWSILSGSGTIANPAIPFTSTSLSPGNNQFIYTFVNSVCMDADTLTVTRDDFPGPVFAGLDLGACVSDSVLLAATSPTVGTGAWTSNTPGLNFSDSSSVSSGVTNFVPGNNLLFWTVTNGVCPAVIDTLELFGATPLPVNAGPDQSLCNVFTASVNGNPSGPALGTWTSPNPSISFATPNQPSSNVSGLTAGSNLLIWTLDNLGCISSDTLEIEVLVPPVADAGLDQFLCDTFATALNGNNAGAAYINWSVVVGSANFIPNSASANVSVTGLSLGVNGFVYAVGADSSCFTTDSMVVIVNDFPLGTVDAGEDLAICELSSATVSADSTFSNGTGQWSVPGSGFPLDPNAFTTQIQGLQGGNNTILWTVSNGACSISDTLIIRVDSFTAVVDAGSDLEACNSDTIALNASIPGAGNGVWTILQGSGQIADTSDTGTQVYGLPFGSTVFQWQVNEGSCMAEDTVEVINFAPPTAAFAGPDSTLCGASQISLNANPVSVGIGTWTGNGIVSPNDPNSGAIGLNVGANIFFWSVTNGICPMTSDSVIITVLAAPSADAGDDFVICDTFATSLSAPNGTGTWSDPSAQSNIVSPNDPATEVSNLLFGINEFVWTVGSGQCLDQDTIRVEVASPTVFPDAGPDISSFDTEVQLNGSDPGSGGSASWTILSGNGVFSDPNSTDPLLSELGEGSTLLLYTVQNGPCVAEGDTLLIEIFPFNVPTGFSPNGDNVNDTWVVRGLDQFRPASLQVFNRWGNQVYESADYQNDWDGGALSDDTYYFTLRIANGRDFNGFIVLKR